MIKIFILVSFLSACGVQQKADDMIDTSHDIHDDTRHVADGMAATKTGLAQAESFKIATEKFNSLFPQNSSEGSWTYEAKQVGDSGMMIKALPFQFWAGGYKEDVAELDKEVSTSLEWLVTQLRNYIPRDFRVDGWWDADPGMEYKALSAIAANLDLTSASFKESLRNKGIPDFNLYSLVIESLRQCNNKDASFSFPLARNEICEFKPDFVYLVQLRHNYLPMMMLSEVTNFSDMYSLWGRPLMLFKSKKVDLTAKWVTEDALKMWTGWLNAAKQARADLVSICEEPQYHRLFPTLVGQLDFGQNQRSSPQFSGSTPLSKARAGFADAFANYSNRSEMRAFSSQCNR